ncbi:MAG: zinc ABC transporter substrate-binding protein [Bacteroidota bacterium]
MKALEKTLILFLCLACFCGCKAPNGKNNTKSVTVSILPLKYFVEKIGGKDFVVNVLVPPGAGPETWEPSPKDMASLTNSNFFMYTGYLEFEVVLTHKLAGKGPVFVDLSKGVNLIKSPQEHHGGHVHMQGIDPHYWLSPVEARVIALHVYESLRSFSPEKKEIYAANYHNCLKEIDSLDHYIHLRLDQKKQRYFVMYHPGLSYFARDYKLVQLSLESEGKQPSTVHMRELIDKSRKNNINAVFIQQQFDKQITESFARELGAELIPIDNLSPDWLNNMYKMTNLIDKSLHE